MESSFFVVHYVYFINLIIIVVAANWFQKGFETVSLTNEKEDYKEKSSQRC